MSPSVGAFQTRVFSVWTTPYQTFQTKVYLIYVLGSINFEPFKQRFTQYCCLYKTFQARVYSVWTCHRTCTCYTYNVILITGVTSHQSLYPSRGQRAIRLAHSCAMVAILWFFIMHCTLLGFHTGNSFTFFTFRSQFHCTSAKIWIWTLNFEVEMLSRTMISKLWRQSACRVRLSVEKPRLTSQPGQPWWSKQLYSLDKLYYYS